MDSSLHDSEATSSFPSILILASIVIVSKNRSLFTGKPEAQEYETSPEVTMATLCTETTDERSARLWSNECQGIEGADASCSCAGCLLPCASWRAGGFF